MVEEFVHWGLGIFALLGCSLRILVQLLLFKKKKKRVSSRVWISMDNIFG